MFILRKQLCTYVYIEITTVYICLYCRLNNILLQNLMVYHIINSLTDEDPCDPDGIVVLMLVTHLMHLN